MREESKKKKLFLFAALIVLLGLAVYSNSFKGQFLWDDLYLVQNNPYIKDWSYLTEIFTSSLKTSGGEATNFYRPIQVFTYLIDYSLWQLNVTGYHLTNVLLHILVALGIYWLIQILFANRFLSFLTALFFVVHPIHTEAVAYISGRADLLAAFFMLSCFILYLKNLDAKRVTLTILMSLSYVLALLSRENSLILPVLLLLYHYTFKKAVYKKPFALIISIAIGYVLWRWALLQTGLPQISSGTTLLERIPGFFVAITNYIGLLLAPFNLHMEYGGILFNFTDPKAMVGIFLLFFLLVYAFKKREQDRLTFFSVGWFFIALLPSSNIYPINAYMAEHWLYLPSIGFFLILARFFTALFRNKKFIFSAITLTVVLLAFYSFLTIRQNSYWREPVDFYKRMIRYAPYSSRLYNNLAMAYHKIGKKDELIELLQKAIEMEPGNVVAYNNLGNAYKDIGKYKEAVRSYKKAIEIAPNYAGPYYNLSLIYADIEKKDEEAIALLTKAIEINPYFPQAYHKIGLIYFNQGEKDKAVALLKKALKINPDIAEIHRSLGYVYIHSGNKDGAKAMYRKAIEIDPSYAKTYYDLSIIYLSEKQYQLATEYYDKATSLGYK